MEVYDLILKSDDGELYLVGTLFDPEFAEYCCSIARQLYEFDIFYEVRDITEVPSVLKYATDRKT